MVYVGQRITLRVGFMIGLRASLTTLLPFLTIIFGVAKLGEAFLYPLFELVVLQSILFHEHLRTRVRCNELFEVVVL